MHFHYERDEASRCSRFCQANQRDRAYWDRHHHYIDVAPVTDCGPCKDDEEKRRKK